MIADALTDMTTGKSPLLWAPILAAVLALGWFGWQSVS